MSVHDEELNRLWASIAVIERRLDLLNAQLHGLSGWSSPYPQALPVGQPLSKEKQSGLEALKALTVAAKSSL